VYPERRSHATLDSISLVPGQLRAVELAPARFEGMIPDRMFTDKGRSPDYEERKLIVVTAWRV